MLITITMQTAGYFLGSVVFMALESEKFCNSYLRSTEAVGGLITLAGFFYINLKI